MSTPLSPNERADLYLRSRNLERFEILGAGKDGTVVRTSRQTALKIHVVQASYLFERDAYRRLLDVELHDVAGFAVPTLVAYDNDLLAIEMTIVSPPFIVDFASARLDIPPDLIEDEGHTFFDFVQERFGEQTTDVLGLHEELIVRAGIYLTDLHPHNIKFGNKKSS